jgi:hypothetical protein
MVNLRYDEPLRTPLQLFRMFESGEITREELHSAMAEHARMLIAEMEEQRRNPVVAYLEYLLNQRAARKLVKQHGEAEVREILAALGELPDFPPAIYLWNATHVDVPLHCFLRTRNPPVLRVRRLESGRLKALLELEYGLPGKSELRRERFSLKRSWQGEMVVEQRVSLKP